MSLAGTSTKRQHVIDGIIENIRCGKLSVGDRLATIREMSSLFNVSLSVVQNALRELQSNGVVECRGASGFYVCGEVSDNRIHKNTAGRMFLSAVHHSDLVWRYPYEKYEKIREGQLNRLLELSRRHSRFCFAVEQAEILDVYVRCHPEELDFFRELHSAGRFEILGGLCIPDLNLICGESIVRNLLLGRQTYRRLLDSEPEVACMTDAFGMCGQLPQILRKTGYGFLLPGRMPNRPSALSSGGPFFWQGLDGTGIPVTSPQVVTHLGYDYNVPVMYPPDVQLARCFSSLDCSDGDILVQYMTEEGKIQEDLFWIIESMNKSGGRPVEFGRCGDYFRRLHESDLPVFAGEFNPVFSGCYTTRISLKQRIRRCENLLLSLEMLDAFAGGGENRDALWRRLILSQFHDAVCGCHTDAANAEIRENLQKIEETGREVFGKAPEDAESFCFCNFSNISGEQLLFSTSAPAGFPVQQEDDGFYFTAAVPAYGCRMFSRQKNAAGEETPCGRKFSTDYFTVDFSSVFPVISSREGENVFADHDFGEILIRADFGSMWTEKFISSYQGRENQTEHVVKMTAGPVFYKVVTEGTFNDREAEFGNLGIYWPGFQSLEYRKEYIFPRHLDYFRMRIFLKWQGRNTKISVRFPLNLRRSHLWETYEVPFGCIVRKPYFEVATDYVQSMKELPDPHDYISARGDWPALNWVNYSDGRMGLTIANSGTPGHQLVNGEILVSLLRGGTEVRDGNMMPQEGSFENGEHCFDFAFRAHSPQEMEKAVELGMMLNRPALELKRRRPPCASVLAWNEKNVVLSAALGDGEKGLILRFYEAVGRETAVNLTGTLLKEGRQWHEMDMNGNHQRKISPQKILFRPFEIKTFRIQ